MRPSRPMDSGNSLDRLDPARFWLLDHKHRASKALQNDATLLQLDLPNVAGRFTMLLNNLITDWRPSGGSNEFVEL